MRLRATIRLMRLASRLTLAKRPILLRELASREDVSTRTIRRDLDALRSLGADVRVSYVDADEKPRDQPTTAVRLMWLSGCPFGCESTIED